jgi:hypothetical protein
MIQKNRSEALVKSQSVVFSKKSKRDHYKLQEELTDRTLLWQRAFPFTIYCRIIVHTITQILVLLNSRISVPSSTANCNWKLRHTLAKGESFFHKEKEQTASPFKVHILFPAFTPVCQRTTKGRGKFTVRSFKISPFSPRIFEEQKV